MNYLNRDSKIVIRNPMINGVFDPSPTKFIIEKNDNSLIGFVLCECKLEEEDIKPVNLSNSRSSSMSRKGRTDASKMKLNVMLIVLMLPKCHCQL